MKVVFDAKPIMESERRGIGYVEANIAEQLLTHGNIKLTLLFIAFRRRNEKKETLASYVKQGAEIELCGKFWSLVYWLFERLFITLPFGWFFKIKADIVHFHCNYAPMGVHGNVVATIHDVISARKDCEREGRLRPRMVAKLRATCRQAKGIITDSEYSKKEIMELCRAPEQQITVVCPGIDHNKFNSSNTDADVSTAKQKYSISGNYFFYVAALDKRKNIAMLIQAYSMALKVQPELPMLVIGGNGPCRDMLKEQAEVLEIQSKVKLLGYVDDSCVAPLMKGATAFLFPSLYEGFGLPPLEAMACGTPVICSNATSLPEVCGDAAIMLDPYDTQGWADAMVRVCADDGLRRELGRKGVEQAAGFTWEKAAEEYIRVYEKVLKNG